jgi:hypothetical protein
MRKRTTKRAREREREQYVVVVTCVCVCVCVCVSSPLAHRRRRALWSVHRERAIDGRIGITY